MRLAVRICDGPRREPAEGSGDPPRNRGPGVAPGPVQSAFFICGAITLAAMLPVRGLGRAITIVCAGGQGRSPAGRQSDRTVASP